MPQMNQGSMTKRGSRPCGVCLEETDVETQYGYRENQDGIEAAEAGPSRVPS